MEIINKIKKNKVVLGATVGALLLAIVGFVIAGSSNDNTKTIKAYLKEEKYSEAISTYEKHKPKDLERHIELVKDYLDLHKVAKHEERLTILKEMQNDFSDVLKDECMKGLVKKIAEEELNIKEALANINDSVLKFEKEIETDIAKAETILNDLKKLYPAEDFSDLEKVLTTKKDEIKAKEEEEKKKSEEEEAKRQAEEEAKQQEEQEQSYEESVPTPPPAASNTPSIGDTYAAQNSGQIITVVSNGDATAELCRWEKDGNGNWTQLDSNFAYLGSGGMKYGPSTYNWDMCTPTGSYSLTEAFGNYSNPGTSLPYRTLDGSEHWVDDENSEYYNTMQFGDPAGRWSSSEHLSSFGPAYNYSIVVDYNRWPVNPGGSSAIFLHCSTGKPTWGCIAIAESKMVETLNWIDTSKNPRILLGFSYEEIFTSY